MNLHFNPIVYRFYSSKIVPLVHYSNAKKYKPKVLKYLIILKNRWVSVNARVTISAIN